MSFRCLKDLVHPLRNHRACQSAPKHITIFQVLDTIMGMKVPSPCEPFDEPSAVPSCEEKGSSEASCEPTDAT